MISSIKQAFLGLRSHLTGAGFLIIQPLILNAISLPVLGLIIHSLGARGFGEWTTATTLIATFTFLTNLGLRMHFVRGVAQDHKIAPVALAEQLGVRILLAMVAALIGIAVCVALHYPMVVIGCAAITAGGLVFATVQTAFQDLFQVFGRLKELATINLISGLVLTGASVVVAWFHRGPLSIAGAYQIGPVLWVLIGAWYTRTRLFPFTVHWNLVRFKEILWQSRTLGMQLFVGAIGNQAEALLVPKIAGFAPNGNFNAGILLPNRLSVVSDGLSTAFYPVMARNFKANPSHLIRICAMYLAASVGLCVPIAIFVELIAKPLSVLLFSHSANADICRHVMVITIWVLPLNAIAAAMGYTLNACMREKAEFKAALISNICGILIAVALTWKFGLMGACWSLVSRYTLSMLVRVPPYLQLVYSLLRHREQPADNDGPQAGGDEPPSLPNAEAAAAPAGSLS